jgi:hypothetical protein
MKGLKKIGGIINIRFLNLLQKRNFCFKLAVSAVILNPKNKKVINNISNRLFLFQEKKILLKAN